MSLAFSLKTLGWVSIPGAGASPSSHSPSSRLPLDPWAPCQYSHPPGALAAPESWLIQGDLSAKLLLSQDPRANSGMLGSPPCRYPQLPVSPLPAPPLPQSSSLTLPLTATAHRGSQRPFFSRLKASAAGLPPPLIKKFSGSQLGPSRDRPQSMLGKGRSGVGGKLPLQLLAPPLHLHAEAD